MSRVSIGWRALLAVMLLTGLLGAAPPVEAPPVNGEPVEAEDQPPRLKLPFGLDPGDASLGPLAKAGAIILGTYFLEDTTTVMTGILISRGHIDLRLGLVAIFIGIFTGDLILYLIGWVAGRRVLRWRWVRSSLGVHRIEALSAWFDRRGWSAVVASRFIPGSRFPLYIAAGALGRKPARFALWTFLAVLIWAPVMLMLVVLLGEAAAKPFQAIFGDGLLGLLVAVLMLLLVVRTIPLLFTRLGRLRLLARVARLWRWEFWPGWIFYMPIVPPVVYFSFKHRWFNTISAANPAIEHGGFVGESKYDILRNLPKEWIVPTALIGEAGPATLEELADVMEDREWEYPVVIKPDVGERGAGVRVVDDAADAEEALTDASGPQVVQPWHPGPNEVGVLYYRYPDEERGRIFSITWKDFQSIEGDGESTVRELVWQHPRFRMQGRTFERRLGGDMTRVLGDGEKLSLTLAGNHCQGTLFRDGGHVMSEELERSIDEIARSFEGFHFGRFDIRFASEDDMRAGTGFRIVELNGVTSESTNIYDPRWTLLKAYRTLIRQWRILFEIGAANRARGHTPSTSGAMAKALYHHMFRREVNRVSD